MNRSPTFLEIDSLSKIYPSGTGLEPTTFGVQQGEIIAILGPSGAGKSTLLRLIAGLETPTSGAIRLAGQEIHRQPAHLRNVAWMAQRPALFPHLDVGENLAIGLRLRQKILPRSDRISEGEIRRKIIWASGLLRIDSLRSRRISELSGGELQRLALGRALVCGSPLWLLDEPFGSLDSHLRNEILEELLLLRGQVQATIILITHDPIEALATATRIGVLGRGRLLQLDEPARIVQNPGHRTVALCLGWPSMNFVDGKSEPSKGSVFCFHSALGSLETSSPLPGECSLGISPRGAILRRTDLSSTEWVSFGRWQVERLLQSHDGVWLRISRSGTTWQCQLTEGECWNRGDEGELFLNRHDIVWFAPDGERVAGS